MGKHYHILNGDALKVQFPGDIEGEIIIFRECLVDGDVMADDPDDFFQIRATFISQYYGDYTVRDYFRETVAEFEKIKAIPVHSSINLWFEDDLFCQVNFWFVVHLLVNSRKDSRVFLIRPPKLTRFGFGGMGEDALIRAYQERIPIHAMEEIAELWVSYQSGDQTRLLSQARALEGRFPFILAAVEAHLDRIPTNDHPGKPTQILLEIIHALGTDDFGPVYRAFTKRAAIYGFGDLQVRRLMDKIRHG